MTGASSTSCGSNSPSVFPDEKAWRCQSRRAADALGYLFKK
jgi:hypothetical protein